MKSGYTQARDKGGSTYRQVKCLYEWVKNDRGEMVRLCTARSPQGEFIDLRTWFPSPTDSKILLPGKGLSLPLDDESVLELTKAIEILADQWESGTALTP